MKKRNERVEDVFTRRFRRIEKAAFGRDCSELLPAMFAIADRAAASSGKDRTVMAGRTVRRMRKVCRSFSMEALDRRTGLYCRALEEGVRDGRDAAERCAVLISSATGEGEGDFLSVVRRELEGFYRDVFTMGEDG